MASSTCKGGACALPKIPKGAIIVTPEMLDVLDLEAIDIFRARMKSKPQLGRVKHLSQMILLALSDLEEAEKNPKYRIDMGTWHSPNSHCSVCFGGAVMAGTLGVSKDDEVVPEDFHDEDERKLLAMDCMRCCNIGDAVENFYKEVVIRFEWDCDAMANRVISAEGVSLTVARKIIQLEKRIERDFDRPRYPEPEHACRGSVEWKRARDNFFAAMKFAAKELKKLGL